MVTGSRTATPKKKKTRDARHPILSLKMIEVLHGHTTPSYIVTSIAPDVDWSFGANNPL
jgi:hypothetical protein